MPHNLDDPTSVVSLASSVGGGRESTRAPLGVVGVGVGVGVVVVVVVVVVVPRCEARR